MAEEMEPYTPSSIQATHDDRVLVPGEGFPLHGGHGHAKNEGPTNGRPAPAAEKKSTVITDAEGKIIGYKSLSAKEWQQVCEFFDETERAVLHEAFREFDLDDSGSIDFDEFCRAMHDWTGIDHDETGLHQMFAQMDIKSDQGDKSTRDFQIDEGEFIYGMRSVIGSNKSQSIDKYLVFDRIANQVIQAKRRSLQFSWRIALVTLVADLLAPIYLVLYYIEETFLSKKRPLDLRHTVHFPGPFTSVKGFLWYLVILQTGIVAAFSLHIHYKLENTTERIIEVYNPIFLYVFVSLMVATIAGSHHGRREGSDSAERFTAGVEQGQRGVLALFPVCVPRYHIKDSEGPDQARTAQDLLALVDQRALETYIHNKLIRKIHDSMERNIARLSTLSSIATPDAESSDKHNVKSSLVHSNSLLYNVLGLARARREKKDRRRYTVAGVLLGLGHSLIPPLFRMLRADSKHPQFKGSEGSFLGENRGAEAVTVIAFLLSTILVGRLVFITMNLFSKYLYYQIKLHMFTALSRIESAREFNLPVLRLNCKDNVLAWLKMRSYLLQIPMNIRLLEITVGYLLVVIIALCITSVVQVLFRFDDTLRFNVLAIMFLYDIVVFGLLIMQVIWTGVTIYELQEDHITLLWEEQLTLELRISTLQALARNPERAAQIKIEIEELQHVQNILGHVAEIITASDQYPRILGMKMSPNVLRIMASLLVSGVGTALAKFFLFDYGL